MKNKQPLILGALVAVLLAVGAFQFMGNGGTPAPVPDATAEATPEEPAVDPNAPAEAPADPLREQLMELATAGATPRDPFRPGGELASELSTAGRVAPPQPVVGNAANPPQEERPSRVVRQSPPPSMGGDLSPLVPPGFGPGALPGSPGISVQPSGPSPEEFGYKVRGVIVGTSKMAVLEDSEGNQRLVPVGGSVDGDSTVVGIEGDTVKVRHRGRKQDVKLEKDR
ncbi:MAG: hypothetical protein MH204_00980 [Fimbriimonadaceae bacterium]|nr:hypothetical protein [Fimbriimonadaceae bacterium]